ncbi:MAG: SIMPL domain-containing protein [Clostridia bacterium]|nr:SIMPL domain-containing protein [Clostridia bacterium]
MRTVTVKGTGKLEFKPDLVTLGIMLRAKHQQYDETMALAERQLEALRAALERAGFARDDLKTADLRIEPEYRSEHDDKGNYRQIFVGYICLHSLNLAFDLEMDRLSAALSAMAESTSEPEFSVQFTVRDEEAAAAALLENAVRNAREKAELLCRASGVALGGVQSIQYHWDGHSFVSDTRCEMANGALPMLAASKRAAMDIAPEKIRVSDTVTIIWEIC